MPVSSIIQCDMCPTIIEPGQTWYRLTDISIKQYSIDSSLPSEPSEKILRIHAYCICESCAEPVLRFQRALVEKSKTEPNAPSAQDRLNQRILTALKKTE